MGRRVFTGTSKGFTLIELLVVISIIGLIATLASVSLVNARKRGRDASRLAAMKQLHTAMEFCNDGNNGSYTTPTACCTLGTNNNVHECTGALLTTYLPGIADVQDPSGVTGTDCNVLLNNTSPCEYRWVTPINTSSYTVRFYLESNGGQNKILTETGIQ